MAHMEHENNRLDYIEFAVSDIKKSKAFYKACFGWKFTDFGASYCEFSDGRMKGGFHTHETVKPGGPMIVLYHEDLNAAQSSIVAAGGVITKETFEFPGGKRFEFKDPDGYQLAVWKKT